MEPPIILDNFGDVLIFENVEDALSYVEPIDVSNGEYVGYDSMGRRLELTVFKGKVIIEPSEIEPTHAGELHAILVGFFTTGVGLSPDWLARASLDELVAAGRNHLTR